MYKIDINVVRLSGDFGGKEDQETMGSVKKEKRYINEKFAK